MITLQIKLSNGNDDVGRMRAMDLLKRETNKPNPSSGILMVLVWLNLTPLAVFIARYAKYYFKRQTLWFTIHKYTGYLSGRIFTLHQQVRKPFYDRKHNC